MASYTYTSGFKIRLRDRVTTKMIVSIIDNLHASFGEGYAFVPEPITEGGIQFANWPGRKDGEYKTIRLCLYGYWPRINDNTLEQWRTGPDAVLWQEDSFNRRLFGNRKSRNDTTTFLKAFYGAPCWTVAELKKFREAFVAAGLPCLKTMPTATSLVSTDDSPAMSNLGRPIAAKRAREPSQEDDKAVKKQKRDD